MVEDNGGGGGGGGLTPLIGTTPIPTTASSLAWECHDGSKVVVLAFIVLVVAEAYCLRPWREERISEDVLVVVVAVVALAVFGTCSFFRSSS